VSTPARPSPRGSAGTSTARLQRLLALVPYVVSRKVVGLAETAAAFGVSERELVDDLNLLWCVELRSPDPYCPIDLSYEGGEIVVSQAESMDRPLRLAVDEASALLVALRMLAEIGQVASIPGLDEGQALNRTIAKLEAGGGGGGGPRAQHPGGHPGGQDRPAGGAGPAPGRPDPAPPGAPVVLRPGPGRGHRA
jgi:proteasome accessory factor C